MHELLPFKQRAWTGLWGMTTSVIQRKGLSKDYIVFIERGIPLYHRSGEKPLDPTTLGLDHQVDLEAIRQAAPASSSTADQSGPGAQPSWSALQMPEDLGDTSLSANSGGCHLPSRFSA